ncbi:MULTISPECIES: ribokinase [Oceanimonas]|uniref:Ribokinase n=1 Tax=Oceanimonas doudoroffii TaxID=84158 RepID=A0A233RHY4_9GAMM|nr:MULTISPECIES: ribokinase [Oceanimonas]NHI00406.1 Ribokinase [Oceanimonas sp. MB9]OXY83003.1 ribokinase [Oceanimonas doudoroffii]
MTLTVTGSINIDHVIRLPQFPRPGETLTGNDYRIVPGGKGANQAVAAARAGAVTQLVACVGEDPMAASLVAGFAADGINTSAIDTVAGVNTGVALIQVNDTGENTIALAAGANAALTPERLQSHASALHCKQLLLQLEIPLETNLAAARLARAEGARVVLNPAPAQALPAELLALVDLITPNETEAERLTGVAVNDEAGAAAAARALHQQGIATVIITLGARGVWLSEQGHGRRIPGFAVKAVDTTAAGDTFNGALVAALQRGQALEPAVRFAQAAAALSVTRPGAQTSVPYRAEIEALLEQA